MTTSILTSPLVMLFIILLIVVFPVFRIIKRTGHSGWWTLLMFVPLRYHRDYVVTDIRVGE